MTNHETPVSLTELEIRSELFDAMDGNLRMSKRRKLLDAYRDAVLAAAPAAVSVPPPAPRADADLPARLEAVLTERFTELGNPFSAMRRQEQGPDGWPASHPVGPHHVAEVLRELLDEGPCVAGGQQNETPDEGLLLCDHCKRPGHSFEDCPRADEPATTCTCGVAGDASVPLGHYRDCPDAAGVRQDGAQP